MTADRDRTRAGPDPAAPAERPLTFVVYTTNFEETSGGAIALHLLAHRLNLAGHRGLAWPSVKPPYRVPRSPGQLWWLARYYLLGLGRRLDPGPHPSPVASWRDLRDAIVVYPEIVSGNPLGAARVVRWLLHRPGFHTGEVRYGARDLYFYFMRAFDDPALNPYPDNELLVTWTNPIYRDEGRTDRSGSCYMMRKGADRRPEHDLSGSIRIDGLSHEETNAAFNRTRYFYCYDLYTRYFMYAAIAGCIPVVVPLPGVSIEQWMPQERDRYGIAYGEENIGWAVETRPLLLQRLAEDHENEERLLRAFVARCRAFFFPGEAGR